MDQGNKLQAQWESLEFGTGGLLFWNLAGLGFLRRMQVVTHKKMTDAVLEIIHDGVTVGHMDLYQT